MPCFQKIKEAEKVPDKCPYCGRKVVENHCFGCEGKGKKKKSAEVLQYG